MSLSLPPWELQQLGDLASQGQLSGVDPRILAGIDIAESSGQGGGINQQGYGGWFGLGSNTTYPGGWQTSPQELSSTSPQAFDAQAATAAAEFASLLQSHGSNPYLAEQAYQGGSSEGTSIFAQLGIPQTDPAGQVANATLTGLNLNPSDLFGVPGTVVGGAASSVWSSMGPFLSKAMLVLLGLGAVGMGLWNLSKHNGKVQMPSLGDAAALAAA
jgi:hypothetical protein